MSVPQPHGYMENGAVGSVDQGGQGQAMTAAGPSNYAHQPRQIQLQQLQQHHLPQQLQQTPPFPDMNGHFASYQQQAPGLPAGLPQMAQQPPFTAYGIIPPQHLQQQQQLPMVPYPSYGVNGMAPNYHFGSMPQGDAWREDWLEDQMGEGQDIVYSNLEVKHRRRTTPEQLKVLEYWYDINPKPDNALREQLAQQLGMTKRNVQVWFQNRRAKMKGLAKKDDKTQEDDQSASEKEHRAPHGAARQSMLLPPVNNLNMARRASLANGEAAKIEMFVAKRAAAGQKQGYHPAGLLSPGRAPSMGQASAARRGSIPYPTPITAMPPPNSTSPKFSPAAQRVMSSALHLAAMKNNTRRASMPGTAQLISSGPFTPPRNVSNQHQVGNRSARELSPIKDHDHENNHQELTHQQFDPESDFSTTYVTPPSSTYNPSIISPISYLPTNSTGYDPSMPFSPNSPLPNPGFTFGGDVNNAPATDDAEAARQQQIYLSLQQRGRMGSLASVGTFTTEAGTDLEDTSAEWYTQDGPEGFDPDARRASAPADLLHQIDIMGLNTNLPGQHGQAMRPSPLGAHFTPDSTYPAPTFDAAGYLISSSFPPHPSSDLSPVDSSSLPSSSGPSPSEPHLQYPLQHQQQQPPLHQQQQHLVAPSSHSQSSQVSPGQMESSVSPYSNHSVPPGMGATYGQQQYQAAVFEGYQTQGGGMLPQPPQPNQNYRNHNGHQPHQQQQQQGEQHPDTIYLSASSGTEGEGGENTKEDFSFLTGGFVGHSDAVNVLV
ncbi:hypothetical protein IAR55_005204 [Kwoniella newhampshirensis]|uniref:Homeobox domain-containing protein n=1 Tax=Kwoniella newhampshirensis TaxID=1651941 RepID=A0AAW0YVS7_9TREE